MNIKYLLLLFLCLFKAFGVSAASVEALAAASGQVMPSLAPMVEKVTPAVVNISTRSFVREIDNPLLKDPFFRRFFNVPSRPRQRATQSLGSGVVVDAKRGYIITNNHVIDKADEITVILRDKRKLEAKLIGRDVDTDIAVIQVNAEGLTALAFADSKKLRVGDFVVAIGNPFGLGQTVTSGIVSALGRSGLGIEGYEDFIQTDASINPGNSGGALVNLRGQLVGVNTAILSGRGGASVGIGFAIPSLLIQDVMQQIIEYGVVKRGRLGVYIQELTADLALAFNMQNLSGAVVSQVMLGSPAEKSGLKAGDVITSANGRDVTNSAALRNVIGLLRVGRKVDLTIVRNGEHRQISVIIEEQQQEKMAGGKLSKHLVGAVLGLNEEDGNFSDRVQGIQVLSIERGTAAWRTGLRRDDIIISVNRILVNDFEELKLAFSRNRRGLLINVQRGEGGLFLLIQ